MTRRVREPSRKTRRPIDSRFRRAQKYVHMHARSLSGHLTAARVSRTNMDSGHTTRVTPLSLAARSRRGGSQHPGGTYIQHVVSRTADVPSRFSRAPPRHTFILSASCVLHTFSAPPSPPSPPPSPALSLARSPASAHIKNTQTSIPKMRFISALRPISPTRFASASRSAFFWWSKNRRSLCCFASSSTSSAEIGTP